MTKLLILLPIFALLASAHAQPAQWPALRGPNLNGLVDAGDPPIQWSEDENIRWKTAIPGSGHASPILWGDHLYVQTAVEVEEDGLFADAVHEYRLLAIHRDSGKITWQRVLRQAPPVEDSQHRTASYASNTGITDGEHLYAYFGSQGLYCLDFDGAVVWEKDLGDMTTRNSFGEGSSPAIRGEVIVVNWDHEGASFIVALDKRTGAELWRRSRDEPELRSIARMISSAA